MKKQHTSTTAEEAEETPRTWDIERYYRRSISSTMLDVIGTVDGRPLTRLENEMRDLDGYLPDYPYEEYYKHCVRAGLISEELLNRAYGGDAAAVSKINMLAPGFIYTDIKIRGWLISHTQKTVQCTDPATARKSQDWLRDAFKIDQPEETEQPSRPVINLAYA